MMEATHITIEKRRYAALIDTLKLARTALLRTPRRFDCPPYDSFTLAQKIDLAIAETTLPAAEARR